MKTGNRLLIVAAAMAVSLASAAPAEERAAGGAQTSHKVVAYYFHVTARCATCRTIEAYSREAIEGAFAAQTKSGKLEWRPVNVQLAENRHFVRDYKLFTRSVVLSKVKDGKELEWRNLEKVWELVGRKDDFFKYIQINVKEFLGGR